MQLKVWPILWASVAALIVVLYGGSQSVGKHKQERAATKMALGFRVFELDKTTVTLGREQYKPSVSRGTYVKYSVELINVEGMKRPYLGELFSVSLKPNGEMHLCNEQVCYEVHRLVAGDPLLTLVASEETFGQMDARSAKSDAEQRFPVKR